MKKSYIWIDGQFVDKETLKKDVSVELMPDLEEWRDPSGKRIRGRSQWREHLKVTDSIEMGHSDMKVAQTNWAKRQDAHKQRIGNDTHVKPVTAPEEIRPSAPSRVMTEMANRMDGRPMPDRKTMIKLTLETARDLARRR